MDPNLFSTGELNGFDIYGENRLVSFLFGRI